METASSHKAKAYPVEYKNLGLKPRQIATRFQSQTVCRTA